jgi:cytochrome P450
MQQRMLEEVQAVLGGVEGVPTSQQLGALSFMDAFLKETLRLHPPVAIIGRELAEDVEVDGYVLPKGTELILSIYSTHRNPNVWAEPEAFNPERFAKGKEESHGFAFMPFSYGPRRCIGNVFTTLEAKTILSVLLTRYAISTLNSKEPEVHQLVTFRPAVRASCGLGSHRAGAHPVSLYAKGRVTHCHLAFFMN